MILGKEAIKNAVAAGQIKLEPLLSDDQYSSTSSLDLRLGDEFYCWDEGQIGEVEADTGSEFVIDLARANFRGLIRKYTRLVDKERDGCCVIRPGELLLATTYEKVELPLESGIAARVEGRSSLARIGLVVHLTAPTIQAGWSGKITLEMVNFGLRPIRLRPHDLRFCQLIFERVEGPLTGGLASQFIGQTSPRGA